LRSAGRTAVVCGHGSGLVRDRLAGVADVDFFEQKEQRGTGHAVMQVTLSAYKDEFVIIMPGDTPLFDSEKILKFVSGAVAEGLDASILTTLLDDPTGYGRVLRKNGMVAAIVEHREATPEQLEVREVNSGVYVVKKRFLEMYLERIENNNSQGEYYLTDIFKSMIDDGLAVGAYVYPESAECMGVNSRKQLMDANRYYKKRMIDRLTEQGVTINDPEGIFLNGELECGKDVELRSPVYICGKVLIRPDTVVGPYAYLEDCIVESGVHGFVRKVNENTDSIIC